MFFRNIFTKTSLAEGVFFGTLVIRTALVSWLPTYRAAGTPHIMNLIFLKIPQVKTQFSPSQKTFFRYRNPFDRCLTMKNCNFRKWPTLLYTPYLHTDSTKMNILYTASNPFSSIQHLQETTIRQQANIKVKEYILQNLQNWVAKKGKFKKVFSKNYEK